MASPREKLGYVILIIVDVVAALFTWQYMVSLIHRSLEVARRNPLSQETVNAMSLAVAGFVSGAAMLILELAALAHLVEGVVS
jgi:hypothetical protein